MAKKIGKKKLSGLKLQIPAKTAETQKTRGQPATTVSTPGATPGVAPIYNKRSARGAPRKADALLIKTGDEPYLDTVKKVKLALKGADNITGARKTRKGDLLLEMKRGANYDVEFTKVKEVLGDKGTVSRLQQKNKFLILGLDELSENDEVEAAITTLLGHPLDDSVELSGVFKTRAGHHVVKITASREAASKLSAAAERNTKIRIGWVRARIKEIEEVVCCYRCHGYGHLSNGCTREDRGSRCWRCTSAEHKASACDGKLRCFACLDLGGVRSDHLPGSRDCEAHRRALDAVRAKRRG